MRHRRHRDRDDLLPVILYGFTLGFLIVLACALAVRNAQAEPATLIELVLPAIV